ncbi:MAG: tetratricopeptide repeat protein [Chloroflexia bacterium]
MGFWSYLAATLWAYFGLLFRAFGNRFGRPETFRRAVACLTRALAHAPADPLLYLWRGTLLWRELGDYHEAEADLTRAIQLDPSLARAYLNRAFARAYAFPPNPAGAAADFRAYLERADDPYWRTVAEKVLQELGDKSP